MHASEERHAHAPEHGGDLATHAFDQGLVAERLHAIYLFCLEQLSRSRFTQDADMLDEIGELLGDLRDAWGQIAHEAGG